MRKKEFKRLLKIMTRCVIQHNGWCCGTCFFNLSDTLGNEDWQSLLFYRGDYKRSELDNLPDNYKDSIKKIEIIMRNKEVRE